MPQSIESALQSSAESSDVDFKSMFDTSASRDWLEMIKDIVAFANSGGGYIFIGLDDDGHPSGACVNELLKIDQADIGNKLHKYTNQNFSDVELIECYKHGNKICAVRVGSARVPIAFTRVGEVELPDGKKKTIFAIGTVYFRHGTKSEPGTSEDLRGFLDREIERTRRSWLDGIAKVVEAPAGSRFAVLPPEGTRTGPSGSLPMTLTSDPEAPAYYAVPLDTTHPYRQKEVILEVNARLSGRRNINSHDIICIRRVFEIQKDIVRCYTQNYASPRYSQQFVDWIIESFESNPAFFDEARSRYELLKSIA